MNSRQRGGWDVHGTGGEGRGRPLPPPPPPPSEGQGPPCAPLPSSSPLSQAAAAVSGPARRDAPVPLVSRGATAYGAQPTAIRRGASARQPWQLAAVATAAARDAAPGPAPVTAEAPPPAAAAATRGSSRVEKRGREVEPEALPPPLHPPERRKMRLALGRQAGWECGMVVIGGGRQLVYLDRLHLCVSLNNWVRHPLLFCGLPYMDWAVLSHAVATPPEQLALA